MKKEYTLTSGDVIKVFTDRKEFERASRQAQKREEQAEERRAKSRRQAKLYACAAIVQVAQDFDQNSLKHYHFAPVEEHCAPNGYLTCKVPSNYALNPNPTDKDFASMEGCRVVTMILFDIMDDAVAFRHFNGTWFAVGVERGVLERVEIPRYLGMQIDTVYKVKK